MEGADALVEVAVRFTLEYLVHRWPRFFGTLALTALVTVAVGLNVPGAAWLHVWTIGAVGTGLFVGTVWQWLG